MVIPIWSFKIRDCVDVRRGGNEQKFFRANGQTLLWEYRVHQGRTGAAVQGLSQYSTIAEDKWVRYCSFGVWVSHVFCMHVPPNNPVVSHITQMGNRSILRNLTKPLENEKR